MVDHLLGITDIVQTVFQNIYYSYQVQDALNSNALNNNISELHHRIAQTLFQSVNLKLTRYVLFTLGIIIVIGVLGEVFSKKTKIPDIPLLMALGVIIGPVVGLITADRITDEIPYFVVVALILIMFDGGLNLKIKEIIHTAKFAIVLSVLSLAASVIVVALIAFYGLHWALASSVLLGAIVGGTGPVVVFSLIGKLQISDRAKAILGFDTSVSSVISIIMTFVLVDTLVSGRFDSNTILIQVVRYIAVGFGVGFGIGIPWMYLESKMQNIPHGYMITIGILFMTYLVARTFGESGGLTALVFGLIIGNKEFFSRHLKVNLPEISSTHSFHGEIIFVIRIFFFVLIGLLMDFSESSFIIFGILMAVAIYLSRVVITRAILPKGFSLFDRKIISSMMPRALAASVLATVPLAKGLANARMYPEIVFIIIISTIVITSIAIGRAGKKVLA